MRLRGCLTLTAFASLALVVTYGFVTDHLPIRFFDSDEWKTASYWDGTRVQMIEHLVWSGQLDGLDRSSVVSLLGPETDTSYFPDHDMVYVLGSERGLFGIDSEWLVIDFDGSGFVARYEVVSD